MSRDRTSLTARPAFERRPASSSAVQRSVADGARSPARSIQQRLGNRASQILISRSAAARSSAPGEKSEPVNSTVPAAAQFSKWTRLPAKVSKPIDPAELEAEDTARKVMRMGTKGSTPNVQGVSKGSVQREKSQPQAPPAKTSSTPNMSSSGAPLPTSVRRQMEPRFGADFGNVRVHTDQAAAKQSEAFSANAFTVGQNIFFGRDKFQPQSASGQQLIAHELTHTIQQGAAVQRSADTTVSEQSQPHVQRQAAAPGKDKKGDAAEQRTISSQVVDLSSGTFNPSQTVRDEIEAASYKGLTVRVVQKGLASEGEVKVRSDKGKQYNSFGYGSMPLINPWADQLGGMHLTFTVKNSKVTGHASLRPRAGDPSAWLEKVRKEASLLGGLGLKVQSLPKSSNKYDGGKLTLSLSGAKVEVGGFLDAGFDLVLENSNKPKINATADVKIKGANGKLALDNSQEKLAGQATIAIELKAFSGAVTVKYLPDGTVDIQGKAAYNADKLSGEILFIATDLATADRFAIDAIAAAGGKNNVQEAPPPSPVPAPKPGKKSRGLAAAGQLKFNLTKWFAGTVNVVVDAKGDVTVIGKIAPPAEIPLFDQKSWDKELIKFEAKAYYGIPVVGNLNLFANISLHAIADLGPAKIYNIEVLGTYSTDPAIQKNIQISGSINISAYAGLRLRAEGGAGIEILSHDLKFGIGINADVGVKAYADARPTIGYRDPGEFYISGTLEMVAQPMLGLGGEFFIMLDAPWWSPLDDDKWAWPLFSKEWPLTDPIGINASVKEYVLGSGKVPEIELKKPEFDPSKFMTNMVDRKLPDKSGGAGKGQGSFKEDGSVPKPVVPPKKPAPPKPPPKPGKKGAAPGVGKSAKPDEKGNAELAAAKALKAGLDGLKSKQPYSKDELTKALGALKGKVKGVSFNSKALGDKWIVTAGGGGKKKSAGQSIELTMKKEGAAADKEKTLFAKGKAAVKKILKWAFATKTFKDGEGKTHKISVSEKGVLTIQSTPKAAKDFVEWYVKTQGGDEKLAAPIYPLIKEAQDVVDEIAKSPTTDENGVPAPDKQKKLLGLSTKISELLGNLVGGNREIGKLEQKYLLEGQVGTYATIPKPVGDSLTPDHQPQASVIMAAADFFEESLGVEGSDLSKRAKSRAAQGYAINLHFKRHVAGATYGSKGETREGFKKKLGNATKGMKLIAAKNEVVRLLREALKKDVAQMKTVAGGNLTTEAWKQLKEETKNDERAKELRGKIADRIVKGEDQIASQPFDF